MGLALSAGDGMLLVVVRGEGRRAAPHLSTAQLALDAEDTGTQRAEAVKDSGWRTEEAGRLEEHHPDNDGTQQAGEEIGMEMNEHHLQISARWIGDMYQAIYLKCMNT